MRWLALVLATAGCTTSGPPLTCPSPLHPSARSDIAPILVAATNQMYVYGGSGGASELWRRSFGSCAGWQTLAPASTPGPLASYAAAFDDSRHRILYVAGDSSRTTWALDTDRLTFTKLATVGNPPSSAVAAAYDHMHDRVIAVGTETFALDFGGSDQGAWTTVAVTSAQTPAGGALDPTRQMLLLLDGGGLHAFAFLTGVWHDVAVAGALPTAGAQLTWDANFVRMLAVADGVWTLSLDGNALNGSFAKLATMGDPPPRTGFATVADGDFLWLFGGANTTCRFDDEWQMNLMTNAWTTLHAATTCQ